MVDYLCVYRCQWYEQDRKSPDWDQVVWDQDETIQDQDRPRPHFSVSRLKLQSGDHVLDLCLIWNSEMDDGYQRGKSCDVNWLCDQFNPSMLNFWQLSEQGFLLARCRSVSQPVASKCCMFSLYLFVWNVLVIICGREVPYDKLLLERYRKALDRAVQLSTIHNLQPIPGTTLILSDLRPTMQQPCTSAKGLGKPRTVGSTRNMLCWLAPNNYYDNVKCSLYIHFLILGIFTTEGIK